MGDLGSIPELGRSPGERKGNLLQYSGLENSMDCIVYGVAKSWTRLSDFHFTLKVDSHDFSYILLVTKRQSFPPTLKGRESHKGVNTRS